MYYFQGGIRIGNSFYDTINYSYPFAKAFFGENTLQLSTGISFLTKMYSLPYNDITDVSLKKGIFSQGIVITHRLDSLPKTIVFWTRRYHDFLIECKKHSISITMADTPI